MMCLKTIDTRVTVTDDGFMLTVESSIPIKNVINLIDEDNFVDYVKRSIMNFLLTRNSDSSASRAFFTCDSS